MKTILIFILFFSAATVFGDEGKVVSITGEVKNVTTSKPLAVNSPVSPGDRITTGAGASIRILLGKDVAIQVGPNSDFVVQHEEARPWSLSLASGMVMSAIRKAVKGAVSKDPKFELKTGAAVMGVRGTVFFVKAEPAKPIFLCVCMGTVDLKVGGGKINKTIFAQHHDMPQLIDTSGNSAKTTETEVGNDHTDKDMNELKGLLK